jgi:hypothetical protein
MTDNATSKHVFISYCHDDRDAVSRLRSELLDTGVPVWWDQDILPGQDWKYEIRKAMGAAGAVLVCLSQALQSRISSGVYPEIADAIAALRMRRPGDVFLIPVKLSPYEVPPLEIDDTRNLNRIQHIDLFPESKRKLSFERLLQSINTALNLPRKASSDHESFVRRDSSRSIEARARTWIGNNLSSQRYYPIP